MPGSKPADHGARLWTPDHRALYNPKLFKDAGLDPDKPPQIGMTIKYAKLMTKRDASGVTTQMGLACGGYGQLCLLDDPKWCAHVECQTDLPDSTHRRG